MANNMNFGVDLLPIQDNTYSLGDASHKWKNIYGTASSAIADGDGNVISTTYLKSVATMTGATSSSDGTAGLVPAPESGERTKFLCGNGTWAVPTDQKVRQTLTSGNYNFPLLMSGVQTSSNTTNTDAKTYRNNNIYANPSTGLITAPKLNLMDDTNSESTTTGALIVSGGIGCAQSIYATAVWGAVWNDYAEFRKDNPKEKELQQPGRCVREVGDGTLTLTDGRLQRGCEIISDTFGFAIGQDKENGYNTPIASSGRVLAYLYEDRELARNFIGWPVCSGPDGTVSIMTEEEENRYSNRIVGTISEIPDYEEWGTGKVKVNGRIWIRIK